MGRAFYLFVILLIVAACSTVRSTVTVFQQLPASGNGATITILPTDEKKAGTLEFQTYSDKLAHYFEANGYHVIDRSSKAAPTYAAFFAYGIDDGTLVTQAYSIPLFGVTGYSGSTTTGTVNMYGDYGTINATTTSTPQYGITGYSNGTTTSRIYSRVVILDIFDVAKSRASGGNNLSGAQVYDARLTSSGTCGSMAGVMDALLGAIFDDFPGESGRARTINIHADHC